MRKYFTLLFKTVSDKKNKFPQKIKNLEEKEINRNIPEHKSRMHIKYGYLKRQ